MLFKLSIKNMKKSFKDYAIYFITLVLGVAVFYMFNSLDSQEAMLQVSSSTKGHHQTYGKYARMCIGIYSCSIRAFDCIC